jgi:gluconolactonase
MMEHEALRPEFYDLIDRNAPVERLGSGFQFTEGPLWHPLDRFLVFSDMPGDVRRRWDAAGGVREIKRPANKCNGMTYDGDLNLIVCEHSTSMLVREYPEGRREVLASHFEGKELNSPNDVCAGADGSIYFTDPWYGRMPVFGVERPRELGFQGVYRVRPGGEGQEPELVVDRHLFDMPNGLCFSPDESLLYINDTEKALIRVYDMGPDGALRNGRLFASGIKSELKAGVPDGMKCDAEGNIWVTAPGGVWVYAPSGALSGKVAVPEMVANLHWGGDDWRTLFLCATTSVYAVETKVRGHEEIFMRARGGGSPPAAAAAAPSPPPPPAAEVPIATDFDLDPARCALIIQDMQNDVVMDGGAFADSGSPIHAREQNVIENIRRLAEACRRRGVLVVHVWFVVEPDRAGLNLNAPLFEGLYDANALIRGSWGAAPVAGLEPQSGDQVVEKMRMSAWESNLEEVLRAAGREVIIDTGAWTNMSIEHTARTGADKGFYVVLPEDACSSMNAEWHNAAIGYALQNVAMVTRVDEVIAALGDAARPTMPVSQGSATAGMSSEDANAAIKRRMAESRARRGG